MSVQHIFAVQVSCICLAGFVCRTAVYLISISLLCRCRVCICLADLCPHRCASVLCENVVHPSGSFCVFGGTGVCVLCRASVWQTFVRTDVQVCCVKTSCFCLAAFVCLDVQVFVCSAVHLFGRSLHAQMCRFFVKTSCVCLAGFVHATVHQIKGE